MVHNLGQGMGEEKFIFQDTSPVFQEFDSIKYSQ